MKERSLEQRLLLLAAALLLLVPLAYAPALMFPAIVPRGVLIRLAGLCAAAALLLSVVRRQVKFSIDATAGFLIFLVALWLIASFTGVSASHSLSGDMERMFGVATWGPLMAAYLALRTLLRSEQALRRLELAAVGAGALALLTSLARVAFTGVAAGTFGNPSFFGIFAAVLGGISLFVAADGSSGRWRWPTVGIALLALGVAVGIGERAAALSVVGGLAAAVLVRLLLPRLRSWLEPESGRLWLVVTAGLVIFAGAMAGGWVLLLSGLSGDLALQFRSRVWGSALAAFAARPLLGYGPENFAVVSSRFIEPAIYLYRENPYVDRAHNVYLDHLLAAGPIGLIGYIGLWASLIVHAVKAWLAERVTVWQAAIAVGTVVGYLAYLFLWFEDLSSLTLMLVFAAVLAFRARDEPLVTVGKERRDAALGPVIAVVSVALVLVLGWQLGGRVALAAASAENAQQAGLSVEARLAAYQRALDHRAPEAREVVIPYVDFLQDFTPEIPAIQGDPYRLQVMGENMDRALRGLDDAIAADPQMDVWWLQRGSLLTFVAGLYGDASYLDYAEADIRRALELSPGRFRNYHFLARLKLMQGDAEGAVAVVDTALSIFDRYPESWWTRAEMLAAADRWDEVSGAMERVYELGSIPRNDVVRSLVEGSLGAGRRELAVELMDDLISALEALGWDGQSRATDADLDWIIRRRIALHEEAGEREAAQRLAEYWSLAGS